MGTRDVNCIDLKKRVPVKRVIYWVVVHAKVDHLKGKIPLFF